MLFHEDEPGSRLRVYYDTRRRDPGPDLILEVEILQEEERVESWELRTIETFRRGEADEGERLPCRGGRALLTRKGGVYTELPGRCLASRGKALPRVRVSMYSRAYEPDPGTETWRDWAPGAKWFGPWLRPG